MSFVRRPGLTLQALEARTTPAAGGLDTLFNGTGWQLLFSGGPQQDGARGLALDAAGRIYLVGDRRVGDEFQMIVARFGPDGGFDPTFGPTHEGFVPLSGPGMPRSSHGYALALDEAGRVLAAGTAIGPGAAPQFLLARFTPDGLLDSTFDGDGVALASFGPLVTSTALAVGVDSAGRVVAAGQVYEASDYDFGLARFTPDGALDPAFGTGGLVRSAAPGYGSVSDVSIDAADRVVVAGTLQTGAGAFEFAVGRYTAAGDLDAGFGGGIVRPFGGAEGGAVGVAIDPAGRVVAAGYQSANADADFALARLTAAGDPDPTFGTAGTVRTAVGPGPDIGTSLVLDPDGRTVVAGWTDSFGPRRRFAIARYTPAGALDPAFGGDGVTTTSFDTVSAEAYQVARDAAGRLLVAGAAYDLSASDPPHFFAAARYNGDTLPHVLTSPGDAEFAGSPVVVDPGLDIADDNPPDLFGATVTVGGYVPGEDAVTFTPRPGITGSFDAATGVLSLTGTAWLSTYRSVLRSVRYANTSPTPDMGPRAFVFAVDDGSPNAAEGAGRRTVRIVSAATPPVLAGVPATAIVMPGDTFAFIATATDSSQPAQALTFSLVGAPPGAAIDPATGAFSWLVDPDTGAGDYTFQVRVTDDGTPPLSDTESVTVTVTRVAVLDPGPFGGGTLTVAGTDGDDVIRLLRADPTHLTVIVNGERFGPYPTVSGVGGFVARGFGGDDRIETDTALEFNVTLLGGDGADTLLGGAGGDRLDGGTGADRLGGRGQTDTLVGGPGTDRLIGGPADDRYLFDRDWGWDTVAETRNGGFDVLDFSAAAVPGVTATVSGGITVTAGGSRVSTTGRAVESVVGSGGATDVLHFVAGANTWSVFGRVNDWFIYRDFEYLRGGSGPDRFVMASDPTPRLNVDGGGGADTVDYSFTRDALAVDLAAGTANGLTGFSRIATFKGQDGNKPTQRSGFDYFTGPNAAAIWTLTGDGAGTVGGTRFIGFDVLTGGPFADTFRFVGRPWGRTRLDGGGGSNALDYSAVRGRVTVNLGAGGATGGQEIRDFAAVTGGAGPDVLIGDAGPNRLTGGGGRDVLIGGGGTDRLSGGGGDDILIGGTTAHDTSALAQSLILTEWFRPSPYKPAPYEIRVRHLLGTLANGLNETTVLNATTVFDDGDADTLSGGNGNDWFLTSSADGVTDRQGTELRTRV